jgi:hypothetical protein
MPTETQNAAYRKRYANDPEFRAKVRRQNKETFIRTYEVRIEAINEWRAKHPKKVRAIRKRHRANFKEKTGVSKSARFVPGNPCQVMAGGKLVAGEIASPAKRLDKVWSVWVQLPWGEVVLFPTKEVQL